ncbi:MAG: hypothetical protein F4060_06805 [Holophagales bacterium]|nr:hypothetical protein [Holophagales bacterium]MYG31790.1 hypothetical protein [Holophagales bacterium]MYI79632.1 hypothetical protein [Holophagales bacterium]
MFLSIANRRQTPLRFRSCSLVARSSLGESRRFEFRFQEEGSVDRKDSLPVVQPHSELQGFALFEGLDRFDFSSLRLTFLLPFPGFGSYRCTFEPELWYELLKGHSRIRVLSEH